MRRCRIIKILISTIFLLFAVNTSLSCLPPPKKKPLIQITREVWVEEGLRIQGKYCDAEITKLDNGKYRIYYTIEPEVPGNQLEMYSAISSDGLNWQQEEGIRMRWSTFPSIIKLSDGRWRMYYQSALPDKPESAIFSAISSDGLNWQQEEGYRIRQGPKGSYDSFNVGSPTVVRLKDGTYKMFYRGSVKGTYRKGPGKSGPNARNEITRILSATSKDGLTWRKDPGIVIDSMNEELRGQVDGPEAVWWDDGKLRLFYSSYGGIYVSEITEDGKVGHTELLLRAQGMRAPSDPTVIKIGNTWRMYYAYHTEGIFSAKLQIRSKP